MKTPYVLARIKTPDHRKGHKTRRYTYQGKRFDVDHPGWYKIGRQMGVELAELKNPATDTHIFDIVELPDAEEIDDREAGEDWSRGNRPAAQGTPVKIDAFKRRQEIKDEVAEREASGLSDGDWDDSFDPDEDDGAEDDEPQEEAASGKKDSKKKKSKKGKKGSGKKGGSRRSSSK